MTVQDYYRGDQQNGITAPDLSKRCEFAEHIVRARGKRTAYTSVSLDRRAIARFGECQYVLLRDLLSANRHTLVEYAQLIGRLEHVARNGEKAERLMALQALRYSRMRKEGLVCWNFSFHRVERKNLINWAAQKIARYFKKC